MSVRVLRVCRTGPHVKIGNTLTDRFSLPCYSHERGRRIVHGTNGHKITLFIADPSPEVRASLRALAEEFPEIELVGEAADAIQATARILKQKPDVAVLDAKMPGGSGADVMGHVHQHHLATIGVILLHRDLSAAASFLASDDALELRRVLAERTMPPEETEE